MKNLRGFWNPREAGRYGVAEAATHQETRDRRAVRKPPSAKERDRKLRQRNRAKARSFRVTAGDPRFGPEYRHLKSL